MLSLPRAWVLFLVRELRSCKLCGVAKKKRQFLPFKFNADHKELDSYKGKIDPWWLQCSYLYCISPLQKRVEKQSLVYKVVEMCCHSHERDTEKFLKIFAPNFFFWILLWISIQQKVEHLKLERDVVSSLYTKKQINWKESKIKGNK